MQKTPPLAALALCAFLSGASASALAFSRHAPRYAPDSVALQRALGELSRAGTQTPRCPGAVPDRRPADAAPQEPVTIDSFQNFSQARQAKATQAAGLFERVLNSDEFHQRMLAGNFGGCSGYTSVPGMDPEQIYQKIMALPVRLNLKLYWNPFTSGIGEVGVGNLQGPIKMNRKFFDRFTPAEVAGNMAHEWMHQIGFSHITETDYCSVPYQIGNLVEELASRPGA